MPSPAGVVYARAGLLGNPSDGYDGKALACTVRNFAARVTADPSDTFAIVTDGTRLVFESREHALDPALPVAGTGLARLVHAALRRFGHDLVPGARFETPLTLSVGTTIPREVGLAGSSAVIIATFRALAKHQGATPPPFEVAEQALATETDDLGIAAGAMDRVIQTYGGVMVMDLATPRTEASYRRLDPALLPEVILAWDTQSGTSSGVAHGDLRRRWLRGDRDVLAAIAALRDLVDRGVLALEQGDHSTLADLFDENFALRCRIFHVGERDRGMVEVVRGTGAAAKLCGSGGAIVAVLRDGVDGEEVITALTGAGYRAERAAVA